MMSTLRARNGVTPITGEFVTTQSVVRKRSANGDVSVERFLVILMRESFTGTVTIGMSQGHVRTLSAEDRSAIDV